MVIFIDISSSPKWCVNQALFRVSSPSLFHVYWVNSYWETFPLHTRKLLPFLLWKVSYSCGKGFLFTLENPYILLGHLSHSYCGMFPIPNGKFFPFLQRNISELHCTGQCLPHHHTDKQYQPRGKGGTRSPPATPHRLQHLIAHFIQNGRQGPEIC